MLVKPLGRMLSTSEVWSTCWSNHLPCRHHESEKRAEGDDRGSEQEEERYLQQDDSPPHRFPPLEVSLVIRARSICNLCTHCLIRLQDAAERNSTGTHGNSTGNVLRCEQSARSVYWSRLARFRRCARPRRLAPILRCSPKSRLARHRRFSLKLRLAPLLRRSQRERLARSLRRSRGFPAFARRPRCSTGSRLTPALRCPWAARLAPLRPVLSCASARSGVAVPLP